MDISGPAHEWRDLADGLTHATDLHAAFDMVAAETARVLRTRVCIVQPVDRDWKVVGQARGGLDLSTADLPSALATVPPEAIVSELDLRGVGRGTWTSIPIGVPRSSPAAVLLAGARNALGPSLASLAAWLPLALASIAEREGRRGAERIVFDAYTMARRVSRLGSVENVARHIVAHVAHSIAADRIALAVHRPEEDRLAIVGTHGYSTTEVQHVRIEPGAWVMGHVFASGRPVLIPDVRQLRGLSVARRPYRTFSFAAVPIMAGDVTIGVLSATDKIDGSAFGRGDKVALRMFSGVAALALLAARNESEVRRLARAANVDSLTGLFNRTYLDARLHEELERARRSGGSVALLMADIDDFKVINDSYGHPTGDSVLQAVGTVLRSAIRVFDVCARYGGDEFAILMPNSDDTSTVASAERIRQRVAEWYTQDGDAGSVQKVTVSIGVATIQPGDTPADLIRRADECLYRAKADGKNAVRATSGPPNAGATPLIEHTTSDLAWPSTCDE